MYSFHQSNELEHDQNQTPYYNFPDCQPDKILHHDLQLTTFQSTTTTTTTSRLPATAPVNTSNPCRKKQHHHRHRIRSSSSENIPHQDINKTKQVLHGDSRNSDEHKLKRILHRDIERQRRQEMTNLCASLRSLLPAQYVQRKRAVSDHMQEAVNYINHLQKNISQLRARRDGLTILTRNLSSATANSGSASTVDGRSLRDCDAATVRVTHVPDHGLEVLISINPKVETNFPISRVLKKLVGEGLDVVSCVSTATNEIEVHKIMAEVSTDDDRKSIDTWALQHQLMDVINLS